MSDRFIAVKVRSTVLVKPAISDSDATDSAMPLATPRIAPPIRPGCRVSRRSTIRLGWSSQRFSSRARSAVRL